MTQKPETFDQLVDGFDFAQLRGEPPITRRAVTIWLEPEDHRLYERLQEVHNKKFCRLLKDLAVMAIRKKIAEAS
jgi:DNA-binding MarR family transcriptional regulator